MTMARASVRESESERARGGRCGGTARLSCFYRLREGAERPAGEGAALVVASHHGHDGGGGYRRERRRRKVGSDGGAHHEH
jgi:hypothetical protein